MEEPLRIRVVFDDRKILTRSQRSEGLKRCWVLLKPGIATISDLASHVRRCFHLKRSCPHGLVLSMDDFVLPPFESTCVLKDNDIIRVRKKDATRMDVIELSNDPRYLQDAGVLEKQQHTVSSDKLLAIREFGEDSCCKRKNDEDLCAHNENAIHTGTPSKSKNKRKHSDGIQGPKKKKLKTSFKRPNVTGDEDQDTAEENEDIQLGKILESSQKRGSSRKSSNKKEMPSNVDGTPEIVCQLEDNVEHVSCSVRREKRRKKERLISPEKAIVTAQGAESIPIEQSQSNCQAKDISAKRLRMKDKQSAEDGKLDAAIASQPDDNVNEKPSSVLTEDRNVQAEENIGRNTCEPHVNGSVTKVQSRSARRKKAKRQWLREIKSQEDQNPKNHIRSHAIHREPPQQQEAEQNAELEKEIVPVVIRPGHIRFQPLDEEQRQRQSQETMETLQWNGTTSKKKGQKWGREKTVSNWKDTNGYKEQSNGKEKTFSKWNDPNAYKEQKWARDKTMSKYNAANGCKGQKWAREETMIKSNDANGHTEQCNTEASKWDNVNGDKEQSNGKALSGEGKTRSSHIDFESLFPLTRIPQVGDVLAYRLIELSSSWCPEVSSFRVGQVTSYNYLSMSVILVPVPEYPIFPEEDIEKRDSMLQANSSPYNEDGSLQIHYPSLVDVRLLKASDSEATPSDFSGREMSTQEAAPVNNWELAVVSSNANNSGREMSTKEAAPVNNRELAVVSSNANNSGREMSTQQTTRVNNWELGSVNSKAKEAVVKPTENGNVGGSSTWDQIKQALNEKKAELQKKKDGWDEWTPNKSNANTSWSYRALRGSAVGPTLAFLRGRNNKRPYRK